MIFIMHGQFLHALLKLPESVDLPLVFLDTLAIERLRYLISDVVLTMLICQCDKKQMVVCIWWMQSTVILMMRSARSAQILEY